MRFARFFLLMLIFSSQAAFSAAREEGGSDAGHSGGGGTFLRCSHPKTGEVFYSFWDLRADCPSVGDLEEHGDRIRLSAAGLRAGGERLDLRKLRSYQLMVKQIKAWKRWAPHFSALIQESLVQDLGVIATPLSIQRLDEIQVAPGFHTSLVVPGAYFDYQSENLYLDLKVWNRAGLRSQAAMLLHELLRRLQIRYQLKNAQIQRTVRRAIEVVPNWTWSDMFNSGFLHCYLINDDLFAPARAREGAWRAGNFKRMRSFQSAELEVREALVAGILGEKELVIQPQTNGRFGDPERKPDPHHESEVLGTCLDTRPDEDY